MYRYTLYHLVGVPGKYSLGCLMKLEGFAMNIRAYSDIKEYSRKRSAQKCIHKKSFFPVNSVINRLFTVHFYCAAYGDSL